MPEAFIISFKLETDENVLLVKAREALRKYNHHLVIANILNLRKQKVTVVTKNLNYEICLSKEEVLKGVEIESKIIPDIVRQHENFFLQQ